MDKRLAQTAELFQTTQQNISLHIQHIYEKGELTPEATHKKYLWVRQEGKRQVQRNLDFYNLNMNEKDELLPEATLKKFLTVRQEGKRQVRRNPRNSLRDPLHPAIRFPTGTGGKTSEIARFKQERRAGNTK